MKQIGIIGAGTMGAGIAQASLVSGYSVFLYDIAEQARTNARTRINDDLSRREGKGELSGKTAGQFLANLILVSSYPEFSHCDLIIEAALERLDIKRDIFKHLGDACSSECIFASNTSSLSITEISTSVPHPERFAGLHFFNPATRMKLVEIVKGFHTTDATLQHSFAFVKSLGKTPIVVKDTPGFIVNRVARPFYGEALRLLNEGVATVDEIDRIARLEGGFKMGPFELMDLIGIDVNFAVTQSIYEQTFHEPRYRPHPIQKMMVDAGQLGKKTGRGFYKYKP